VTPPVIKPENDLIEHLDRGCPCGPTQQLMRRGDDGAVRWAIVHHSLDGREKKK
jgi:hypothetical protein